MFNDSPDMFYSFFLAIFYFLGGLGLIVSGFCLFSEMAQLITGPWLRYLHRSMSRGGHGLLKSTLMGIIASFFTQSTPLSSFMAFSFASSGLFSLHQLSGFLLGASLGTLPTIGLFFLNPLFYGLPLLTLGIFSLTYVRDKFYFIKFFFSIGIILLGYHLFELSFEQSFVGESLIGLIKLSIELNLGEFWLGSFSVFIFALLMSFVIRSRLALVALVMPLAVNDILTLQASLAFVIGVNVGSVMSVSLYSARGSNLWKRATLFYFLATVFWAILSYFLIVTNYQIVWEQFLGVLSPSASLTSDPMRIIGFFHIFYNVGFVLMGLILTGPLLSLSKSLFPTPEVKESQILKMPVGISALPSSLAIEQAQQEVRKMFAMVMSLIELAMSKKIDESEAQRVIKYELITDNIDIELNNFSKSIFQIPLTDGQVNEVLGLLRLSEKLESLADHGKGLLLLRVELENDEELEPSLLSLYHNIYLGVEGVFSYFTKSSLGEAIGDVEGIVDVRKEFAIARSVIDSLGGEKQQLSKKILKRLGEIDRLNRQIWSRIKV